MKPSDFHRQTFDAMLVAYQYAQTKKKKRGPPAALSLEEQVLFTLEFWRAYPTLFHHSFQWNIHEATGLRSIERVESALIASGWFTLPSKRALRDDLKRDCVMTRGEPEPRNDPPILDEPHALEATSVFNTRRFTKPATTPSN
jgi:Helix-turn-helix of DDE superfamily endonuclease